MLFSYPGKSIGRLLVDFVIRTTIKVPLRRRIRKGRKQLDTGTNHGVFFHKFIVRAVAFKCRLGFVLKSRVIV